MHRPPVSLSLFVSCAFLISMGAEATAARAQIPGNIASSALPDVASTGAGNAAGVLSYCLKNKLVDAVESNSAYGLLAKKPDVAEQSDAYKAGASGTLISGNNVTTSLDKMPKSVRKTVCNMVLKQSRSFL